MIVNDLQPITILVGDTTNIYFLGDIHLGSKAFRGDDFQRILDAIIDDPNAKVVLNGDLIENKNKYSQGNSVMEQTMTPQEQAEAIVEMLMPIKDKIVCSTSGNHEWGCEKHTGIDLSYWIANSLGCEYRKNACIIKWKLMDAERNTKEWTTVNTHGSGGGMMIGNGLNRIDRWANSWDGVDLFAMGHTHTPLTGGRSRMEFNGSTYVPRDVKYLVHPSFMDYGGYALRGMLCPSAYTFMRVKMNMNELKFEEV